MLESPPPEGTCTLTSMAENESWSKDDDLEAMLETRAKLESIEREWKQWRQQSRALTLRLVTVHGFSVAKASLLSGHHRTTITVWLQVHNAEHKSDRNKN